MMACTILESVKLAAIVMLFLLNFRVQNFIELKEKFVVISSHSLQR